MKVGDFIIDSNGNEIFVPTDSAGYYLIKDAEIMIDILKNTDVDKKWEEKINEGKTDQLLADSGEPICR